MQLNVLDYASVQAALDAADDGDRIYFPGLQRYTTTTGWAIPKRLTLFGDGPGSWTSGSGSILVSSHATAPLFAIASGVSGVEIRDMQLLGPGGIGSSAGILCLASPSHQTQDISLSRLFIADFPGHGIDLSWPTISTGTLSRVSIDDCVVKNCGGAGINLLNVLLAHLAACQLIGNQKNGIAATGGSNAIYNCTFDGNSLLASWSQAANPKEGNLKLDACLMSRVDACRFTNLQAGNVQKGCVVATSGPAILGPCYFDATTPGNTRGIELLSGVGPVNVFSNRFKNIKQLVVVNAGAIQTVVMAQLSETAAAGTATVSLPSPNGGMFGGAHVIRNGALAGTGMIVPSGTALPAAPQAIPGTLFYNSQANEMKICVAANVWKTIQVV